LVLADWLTSEQCTHVAMEATGVYWKPVWHILSDGAFELVLANARHVKNVPGRKKPTSIDATLAGRSPGPWPDPGQISCRIPRRQVLRSLLRTRKQPRPREK